MSGFEPGEGWREMGPEDGGIGPGETYLVLHEPDGDTTFVRELPVPPLPTEPYTVIRAKVRRIHDVAEQTLVHMGGSDPWIGLYGGIRLGPVPADSITGFEVLAEPRAVTAKAVLDRVLHLDSWSDGIPIRNIEALARELGAES